MYVEPRLGKIVLALACGLGVLSAWQQAYRKDIVAEDERLLSAGRFPVQIDHVLVKFG